VLPRRRRRPGGAGGPGRGALDAVVVGAGPNGLAAAATLAGAGWSVLVVEAGATVGGGARTAELTLPGFHHDICSAVHPLSAASPYLEGLRLERHGLRWLHPDIAISHPLPGGRAGAVWRDVEATARQLGPDERAWRRHVGALARRWDHLAPMLLAPMLRVPRHPLTLARFGLPALAPATLAQRAWFDTEEARSLFAGCAAHALVPLEHPLSASFGLLLLASAHAVGWPLAAGGSQAIVDALAAHLRELGVGFELGHRVRSLDELPPARVVLLDVAPGDLARIAGDRLSPRERRAAARFRHGPAAFKLDYALDGPVPWADPHSGRAGTVHVAGTAAEVALAEREVAAGRHPERPYVLVAQPSLVDPSRAPAGKHVLWAYCHVPNGSDVDMTEAVEAQLERFAPGFRDLVLARHVAPPAWFADHNPNAVGGDFAGGSNLGLRSVFRPRLTLRPYATSDPGVWLCSASTPPGAGVHGMCGHHAATAVLRAAAAGRLA
jgi:phytoene dehydrogenase-like protein